MIRAIAARLGTLPSERLQDVAYPIAEWMKALSERFYTDASEVLPSLWTNLMVALRTIRTETRHRDERSWATDALNAPVGKLCDFLFKDPAKDNLKAGAGFPRDWTQRFEDLLTLPGDMRQHALVMLASQLNWLFTIDPTGLSSTYLRMWRIKAPMAMRFGMASCGPRACHGRSFLG
jgi:hypothetical protein